MKAPLSLPRAMLLGATVVMSGCDIAALATDPAPRFEQTWNLPASSSSISVAQLLPSDSTAKVLPDSSGFSLKPANVNLTERLGTRCAQCATLNGTTAIKPAFAFTTSSSAPLATDVVAAKVTGGTANLQLTNNLTFDPLKVRASGTQGRMVIVIHSGSLVLGRDSLDGASITWPAGSQLARTIALATGDAQGAMTVDVTIDSPVGDTPVQIDASRTLVVVSSVPALSAATIGLNVNNKAITSANTTLDLDGLDKTITDHVTGGEIQMTLTNPFAITGNLNAQLKFGSAATDTVLKSVSLPSGAAQLRTITLSGADMNRVLGKKNTLTFNGIVSAASPITVGPKQKIAIANRLQLTILTGGGQ